MAPITSITTAAEHEAALQLIDEIIAEDSRPKEGTALYDELIKPGELVSAYEDVHYPIK